MAEHDKKPEPLKDPVECDDCGRKIEREEAFLLSEKGRDDYYICADCYRWCIESGADPDWNEES